MRLTSNPLQVLDPSITPQEPICFALCDEVKLGKYPFNKFKQETRDQDRVCEFVPDHVYTCVDCLSLFLSDSIEKASKNEDNGISFNIAPNQNFPSLILSCFLNGIDR